MSRVIEFFGLLGYTQILPHLAGALDAHRTIAELEKRLRGPAGRRTASSPSTTRDTACGITITH
ncbi:hypothetical protein ACFU99_00195 [Streptomyces sp. NPDC057654]|uniref:hypothetical protein n=1 Tax=Streptomyces sp. NPDC057654 TaxID=3346196 RepID=UPI0036C2E141